MIACAIAFVSLSAFQVGAICTITVAAIGLSYLMGLDDGAARERTRRRDR